MSHREILERADALLQRQPIEIKPVADGVYRFGRAPWLYEYEDGVPVRLLWLPWTALPEDGEPVAQVFV